ncbi:hypothetical protein RLOC_00006802 [Lonchura striata]|uniref:Uncharacterized protein n=1 Tax=Lonchura striata TaxID=40157 RepID=A0A218UK56_9PASE|nr:hypothetical protein RLOC_00006802 [Lonchura striata domestica]
MKMPSTEKIEKESPDEPDSDSEDELTEEENQRDTSSTEMQEESQSSGAVGRPRPKPAYLSSNPKSQSRLAVTSNSCSQRQKIRYSRAEKSIFYNILMKGLTRESCSVPPLLQFPVLSAQLHCWEF